MLMFWRTRHPGCQNLPFAGGGLVVREFCGNSSTFEDRELKKLYFENPRAQALRLTATEEYAAPEEGQR
jgi:hypothetical protein